MSYLKTRPDSAPPENHRDKLLMSPILGSPEDVRHHGFKSYAFAYVLAAAFLAIGFFKTDVRAFLWPLAIAAFIARHVIGDPVVTAEVTQGSLVLRGFGRKVRLAPDALRAVLFGSGEYSSAPSPTWLHESYHPKEHNTGSSRFVVLHLDKFYWGIGRRVLIPTSDASEAEEAAATLRKHCTSAAPYRGLNG